MATVYIDGQPVELPAGKNLLEALLERDINVPYFCWHPDMGSIGACRQCAVVQYRDEDDDRGRIVMSCMTPVAEGALFSIDSQNARNFRERVVEGLMVNHPHDCPVCEEGGECHLQDMTVLVGHRDRKYRGAKVTFRNQYLGPLIGHEMNRCITCYRCVRFYQDYAGGRDLGAFASRDRVYFGRAEDGVLENEFAGNLVEVCPTGVFTDKPLGQRYTRKWDLQSAPTICTGCSLGCNTSTAERYGELRRIHNRYNHRVNGYFLCDRGRFGGDFVNSDARLRIAGIRNEQRTYDPVSREDALESVSRLIRQSSRVAGIGSPRATIESNYALARLVGMDNFFPGMNETSGRVHELMLDIISNTSATLPAMAETEEYDAVIVLGEDVTNHAPRLALSLRQATRNEAKRLAEDAQIPVWNDAAVRKLTQDQVSPLILLTPCEDRLDDVATVRLRQSPDDIARLGFAIANRLDDSFPSDGASDTHLDEIVRILEKAKKPLVVSGTGLQHSGILKAAANIAAALAGTNDEAGIMLCADECNSVGVTMMQSGRYLESILEEDTIDTVIVLENDLSYRLSPAQFKALREKVKHMIVIDHMDNETTSVADVALPAATFAESHGTFVNNEGTAQLSYAAFTPEQGIVPAWSWLTDTAHLLARPEFAHLHHMDDLISDCASNIPALAAAGDAAPGRDYREAGMKVARMSPRYSGRTAMNAHLSVHEPKPPEDTEAPLAFSMEGTWPRRQPALRPYVWAPGWNSSQSVGKFQDETGGPLKGGDPGVRLLKGGHTSEPYSLETSGTDRNALPLVRRHHIFGSDELSSHSRAIADLIPRPYCMVGNALAQSLGVANGDGIEYELDGDTWQLEVAVDPHMADDCMAYPAQLMATRHLCSSNALRIRKATNWVRRETDRARVFSSDRKI
ncbi:MAG: NADH-quinone oxidoreductase subunit NuoG [Pseudomonadales bacterium]